MVSDERIQCIPTCILSFKNKKSPAHIHIYPHIHTEPKCPAVPWPLSIECRRSRPAALRWRPRPTPPPFFPLHFQAEDDVCFAALCRIVSRPRPCGDGALWEIWAVGASHAGGSSSSGHSAAAVPAGDDGRGISVFACSSPDPGGTRETTLNSPWGYWSPPHSQHGTL